MDVHEKKQLPYHRLQTDPLNDVINIVLMRLSTVSLIVRFLAHIDYGKGKGKGTVVSTPCTSHLSPCIS
jgi:hypothetical protein